ncbi:MAG: CDP-alcohol phosphatidyltransferase family protein [Candidatus Omnitrophica bacterium]|nr:CDP-alcohol phosphatidyltransferase family protein [Candidatus Omnitrophota bacterium]
MRYANKISAFRILTIPFLVATILYYTPQKDYLRVIALVIFFLAIVSDVLDGLVARIYKEKTKLGPILDPLADKLLLMSAYIFLFARREFFLVKLPLSVVLVVISRDAIILLGTFLIFLVRQDIKIIPTSWGKLTTFFQMSTIVVILLEFKYSHFLWNLAILFTVISGIDYIRRGFNLFTLNDDNITNHK